MGSEAEATKRVGDYVLGRRIAVGGMAEIFEARREGAGQDAVPLVLKLLLPQYARDAEVVRMLEHEAELQERLEHAGLVRVLEHGQADGQPYLVMERVDGLPLSEIARDEPLCRPLALYVIREVAAVLAFVHEARDDEGAPLEIVHRDVTPQNILVSRRGEVRLGDFGIARSSLRDARTRTGVIKGKLRYVAPEQVTGSAIDARTDLYSLGVVAFELLTGEPYLTGDSEIELLRAAESPTPKPLGVHADDVDPKLERLVSHTLARFAEERPSSARLFVQDLDALRGDASDGALKKALGERVSALAPPLVAASPRPVADAPPKRRWGLIIVLVIGLGAVAVRAGMTIFEEPGGASRAEPETPSDAIEQGAVAVEDAAQPPASPRDSAVGEPEDVAASAVDEDGDGGADDPPRPTKTAGPRTADRPSPRDRPTMSPAVEQVTIDESRRSALASRLSTLRADLRRRGVRPDDLELDLQRQLTAIDLALAEARLDDADATLAAVAPNTGAVVVDAAFVRRKMERVDAAIRRADRRGADTERVERLSASALSDFMAGRHDAANRRLNEILGAL